MTERQLVTPAERLDAAEELVDGVIDNLPPESASVAHALIAIGRLLQNIDTRQGGQ